MKKGQGDQSGGAGHGKLHASRGPGRASAGGRDRRGDLVGELQAVGLDEHAAALFGDAALVLGALSQGQRVRDVELASAGASALDADAAGTRPRDDAAPGSMEESLHEGDVALGAVEALAACTARLEAAMVMATGEQVTAVGGALLAQRDVSDPGELSRTARERWRARAKSRVRQELAPAIGWTPGECAHLVGLTCAPVAFSTPVVAQMAQGVLPWRLARSLWRACEGLDAADAAHIATVMCGDDPTTCVPERLAPDGTIDAGRWQHRAFYSALTREVAKVAQADDADPEVARLERARREAAWAGRRVSASVDEDGTGALTVVTSAFWVAAIKDRLNRAARTARGAGDQRTLDQLESDIARILLGHAIVGFADQPDPAAQAVGCTSDGSTPEGGPGESGEGTEAGADGGASMGTDDLLRAGWSPEMVQALAGLPPAVLQVIVPLMGLHDPAVAETLPTVGRASTVPDPNTSGPAGPADDPRHPGRPGCPACLPGVRTGHVGPEDGAASQDVSASPEAEAWATGEGSAFGPGSSFSCDPDANHGAGASSAQGPDDDGGHQAPGAARRLWVGEVLGNFSMFVSPADVRALALAPGTTLSRLLVDPADGRCVERSSATYRPDAAMRAQILAADVTCRAPACNHPGSSCQVDHVLEYGTPGGLTKESNGQLAHTAHHEAKTAQDWDADLSANRDVRWTTLLGRIYRTRGWDYRRYVTLLVDAIDAVRSAPAEDQATELDRQVYLALTHRDLGERLNVGDDDLDPDISRFEGWPYVGLSHRDRHTGSRAPGPSADAVARVHAARATSASPSDPAARETDPGPVGPRTQPDRLGTQPASEPRTSPLTDTGLTPPGPGSVPNATDAVPCKQPCCRSLREASGRGSGGSSGNGAITRIDGRTGKPLTREEYRALCAGWILSNEEGIPPF